MTKPENQKNKLQNLGQFSAFYTIDINSINQREKKKK